MFKTIASLKSWIACIIANKLNETNERTTTTSTKQKSSRSLIGLITRLKIMRKIEWLNKKLWRKFADICSLSIAVFMVIKIVESLIIDSLAKQSSTELKKKSDRERERGERNNDDACIHFMFIKRIEIELNVWCCKIHFHLGGLNW